MLGAIISVFGQHPTPRHLEGLTIWSSPSTMQPIHSLARPGSDDEDLNVD
jgi:hypothetical protein